LNALETHASRGVSNDLPPRLSARGQTSADVPPTGAPTDDWKDNCDPVERALVRALEAAAAAGRFDVVAQLARELEARRLAREPNIIALGAERRPRQL